MSERLLSIRTRISYPGFRLDVDEALSLGGCTAIFGPSGGGKTTLLRLIAGFEKPEAGHIRFDGAPWFDSQAGLHVPAHKRPVGYMFQDARLFAHLSVEGNLLYAAKRSPERGGGYGFAEVVAALDLKALLARGVQSLSGGERQRVALGRTLLARPALLLLDEPLAALDRKRKSEILPYLEELPRRFDLPTLFISHDIEEVSRLADRIVVLGEGRVRFHGKLADIIGQLDEELYINRFEASSLLNGEVTRHDPRLHLTYVDIHGAEIAVPLNARLTPGEAVRLRIRLRDVAVATEAPRHISIRNVLPGRVSGIEEQGDTSVAVVSIALGAALLKASITRAAVEDLGLAPGMPVFALVKSVSFD